MAYGNKSTLRIDMTTLSTRDGRKNNNAQFTNRTIEKSTDRLENEDKQPLEGRLAISFDQVMVSSVALSNSNHQGIGMLTPRLGKISASFASIK